MAQGGERETLLLEASDFYESWKWGDPNCSKDEAAEIYIEAERVARAMDERHGHRTSFARNPITVARLTELGIDPETLEPIAPDPT